MSPAGFGGMMLGSDVVASSTPSFSPLSLSPTAWFRSDLGISLDGSNNVETWNDQSGNGYNVTQGTSAERPAYNTSGGANGRQRLTWTESDMGLQNTSFSLAAYPVDIFVVATYSATLPASNGVYMIDLGSNNDVILIQSGTPNPTFYDGILLSYTNNNFTQNVPAVLEACNLGSASTFINMNGGTPTTGSTGTTAQAATSLTIGNYGGGFLLGWIGDIYEVVIFSSELSSGNRNSLLAYFTSVYGIIT
jgi:hypothetical protein